MKVYETDKQTRKKYPVADLIDSVPKKTFFFYGQTKTKIYVDSKIAE